MGLDSFPIPFFIQIPICTPPLRFSTYLDLSFNSHLYSVSQPLTTRGENLKQWPQSLSADFTHSLPDARLLSRSLSALDPGSSSVFMSQLLASVLSLCIAAYLALSSTTTSSLRSVSHTRTFLLCLSFLVQWTWPHSPEISLFHLAIEHYLSAGPWAANAWFTGPYFCLSPASQGQPQNQLGPHNAGSFKVPHRNITWKSCDHLWVFHYPH